MSASTSPVAPVQTRDIRSASVAYKRDKDHGMKWAQGIRPRAGQQYQFPDEDTYGEMLLQGKVRPANFRPYVYVPITPLSLTPKLTLTSSGDKTHSNRAPKTSFHGNRLYAGTVNGRLAHKIDAILESNDHTSTPLSKSLLSILPQHANNTSPSISTMHADLDADILYNFDNRGPSPGQKASRVALDGLIEQAEQKWIAEQTEKIIRGEYEVLDADGEKTVLKKGKKSPKQKAVKAKTVAIEEDDFELI
jgi:hypothetical protein